MNFDAVIPTYNRAESLGRLLGSLNAVDCPPGVRFRIIVVDNGSRDDTAKIVAHEQRRPSPFPLRMVEESRPGKAAALNCGIAHSYAELLAILDDDVVVDHAWLAGHVRAHQETNFDAVQGRVLPGAPISGARQQQPRPLYEYNVLVVDYGEQAREIRGFAGTNVSFKRKVIDACGPFDVRLGPGAAGYSEDSEYSVRVRSAGFKIGYAAGAVAYHELNPSRYGRHYNRLAEYRKGLSRSVYRRESLVRVFALDLIGNCLRYGVYRMAGQTTKAYKTEGRIMKSCGYLVGRLRGAATIARGDRRSFERP